MAWWRRADGDDGTTTAEGERYDDRSPLEDFYTQPSEQYGGSTAASWDDDTQWSDRAEDETGPVSFIEEPEPTPSPAYAERTPLDVPEPQRDPAPVSTTAAYADDDRHNQAAQPMPPQHTQKEDTRMADYNQTLAGAMDVEGALGAALVDSSSGMTLATAGSPPNINLDVAAAGNSSVVNAKVRTLTDLGLNEHIEDILITLETQYHIIRMFKREPGVFLYLVLDKNRANLAMARFKLAKVEQNLTI